MLKYARVFWVHTWRKKLLHNNETSSLSQSVVHRETAVYVMTL